MSMRSFQRTGMPHVTFVRNPIVAAAKSFNNEATPCIAFAYLSAYIARRGYDYRLVDGIAEGLNQTWPLSTVPGFRCQGLTYDEILERIPADTDVIAFSAMFSGEWPVLRDLILYVRERHPHALFVAGGEHITALTEFSLRDCPALDLAVCGEGGAHFLRVAGGISRRRRLFGLTVPRFSTRMAGLSRSAGYNASARSTRFLGRSGPRAILNGFGRLENRTACKPPATCQ